MITAYPPGAGSDLIQASWIDLLSPTDDELATVERTFGVRAPTREEVSEIQASSRLKTEGEALYMSAPLLAGTWEEGWQTADTGFVLCSKVCITVRFDKLIAFEAVAEAIAGKLRLAPAEVLIRLLEEVVDRAADHLEVTAEELNQASRVIFSNTARKTPDKPLGSVGLRAVMTKIGQASDHMSHARYTLVSIARMTQFVTDRAQAWISDDDQSRLNAIRSDISSLELFEENQLSRVQLLQDAATAFISIQQNDVVKVLTIASVVGVPPVLVVGVYGMNFRVMPELHWAWGYPFALALMVLSAVVPLVWFKVKRWM
jgi:magnesium transporter